MSEAPNLTEQGEAAWENFRCHVEWSEHFSLFFLFCSAEALADLYFKRLDNLFRYHIAPSERLAPSSPEAAAEEILGWVRRYPKGAASRSPIWLDLSHDHDPAWSAARANLLARLNEHREVLRNKLNGPFIVVLPVDYRPRLWEIAPDLWSIRQYSQELRAEDHLIPTVARLPTILDRVFTESQPTTRLENAFSVPESHAPSAVDEWGRILEENQGALRVGWKAFEDAYSERRLETARRIATDVERLARKIWIRSNTPESVHDLSVSLDNIGIVAEALGYFKDAESAYHKSLALRRTLRERPDNTKP